MNKEEMKEYIEKFRKLTNGEYIDAKSLTAIFLLAIEAKEIGLKSDDFIKKVERYDR